MGYIVTGTADQIAEVLCGARQHDEHCKGWRWHMYCRDDAYRMANVNEAARKLIAAHHARTESAAATLRALEAAE